MSTSLTTRDGLASLLGSFWTGTYQGRDQILALCAALAEFSKQLAVDSDQAQNIIAYDTAAPYRRERWFPLVLDSRTMNTTQGSLLRFGDGAVFGSQPAGGIYQYGVSRTQYYEFPAPPQLRQYQLLTSRIGAPAVAYTEGVDVQYDSVRGVFRFLVNPFLNNSLATQTLTDGTESFQTVTLWLADCLFDQGDIYTQFGYIFGMDPQQDSAVQQRGLLPVAKAITTGTTEDTLKDLLAAATGITRVPAAETVQLILQDARGAAVVTDVAVHRVPADAAIPWQAGDTIPAGGFVTADVQMQDCRNGQVPVWLQALTLTPGMLSQSRGALTFPNQLVDLVKTTEAGQELTSFLLGGTAADRDAFFQELHRRLQQAGLRLGALTRAAGEPIGQVNPCRFLIQQWLRGCLVVIQLTGAALRSPGSTHLRFLQELTPPNVLLILIVALQAPSPDCIMGPPVVTQSTGLPLVVAPAKLGPLQVTVRQSWQ